MQKNSLWIRSPLAILAESPGGIVVRGGRISELLRAGEAPSAPVDEVFDASRHVVLPGLVNNSNMHFSWLRGGCAQHDCTH